MSDARADQGNDSDETDVAIDEEEVATEKVATAAEPTQPAPPSLAATAVAVPAVTATPATVATQKPAVAPPPAAGAGPNAVATPKPGSLAVDVTPKQDIAPKQQVSVTEPAPPEAPQAEPPPSVSEAPVARVMGSDGLHVVFAGMTSVGLVREHNEDNLVIGDLATKARVETGRTIASSVSSSGALFAVCDGMGGAAAGEVASQMAVDFLFEQMNAGEFGGDRDRLARHLVSVVERAGKEIFDTAQADRSRRGMGTTSTVAVLLDKVLFVAQVGDSRAYILRNGVLRLVTKDQSLVNQLIEAGHLTEEEAEAFEHSNIILQALGTSEKVQVDLTFVELRQSDRLMMCSDGLSGLVHQETIAETLRTIGDPTACCAKLTELANEGGGHDNITIIVADFAGNALPPPQSGENAGYNQYPLFPEGAPGSSSAASHGNASSTTDGGGSTEHERGGVWQWWAMGLVAILLGVAISWWWENKHDPVLPEVTPAPPVAPEHSQAPAIIDEAPEPELVPAHISTDAEAGLLLIDGKARGPLAASAPLDLDLAPGSYKIELQIEGSVAVTQVALAEAGKPLDIELMLPSGAIAAPETAAGSVPTIVEPPRRARRATVEGEEPAPKAAAIPAAATTPSATGAAATTTSSTPTKAAAPTKAATKPSVPANPF